MAINYKVIPRKNPQDTEADPKYYASINAKGKRDTRYIGEQIADRSSLNLMDILSVIEGFLQIVPVTLLDGYIVDLGGLGSMVITAKSEGADTEENFHSSLIKGTKVSFHPSKLFKQEMNNAEFKKIDNTGS